MSVKDGLGTPFRSRPLAPKLARSGEIPQPWTAARCHRLLRPLVSRIASLRKDAAISLSRPLDPGQVTSDNRTGAKRQSSECDWLLPSKKAKLHRTYSQKRSQTSASQKQRSGSASGSECSRQSGGAARLQGEIVASTPLLRRARGHIVSSPPQDAASRGETKQALQVISQPGDAKIRRKPTLPQKKLDERLAALKPEMPPSRHSDYEAIYRSLEALLTATNANENADAGEKRGPRSFLDMCLRKVPEYILDLEAWEKSEAEENGTFSALESVDTSVQIYNELESLGPVQGWRHLKVVVRADGLRAVKEAISDGLFDDAFLGLLVDLCMVMNAHSEAEELVEAMTQRQYPYPQSPDTSFSELPPMQPLSALWYFATKIGCTPYLLRQNTLLLSNGSLPRDWLGTREFERVWGLAVRNISKAEAAGEATDFMIKAISLLSTRKRRPNGRNEQPQAEREVSTATQQALVSALATVTAMSSLGENEIGSSRLSEINTAKVRQIGKRLQYILQSSLAEVAASNRVQASVGTRLLHLALFLSSTGNRNEKARCTVKENIEHINRSYMEHSTTTNTTAGAISTKGDRAQRQYNAMISLIASTARSCARGLSLPSHDCLESLFQQQLGALGLEAGILDRMKAASAFTLAQQTHNVRDLIYAEKLTLLASSSDGSGRIDDVENGQQRHRPRHHYSNHKDEPHAAAAAAERSLFAGYRWDATIGEWVTVSPVKQRANNNRQRRLLRSSSANSLNSAATTRPPIRHSPVARDVRESESEGESNRYHHQRTRKSSGAANDHMGEASRGAHRGDCLRRSSRRSSYARVMKGAATAATTTTAATTKETPLTSPSPSPSLSTPPRPVHSLLRPPLRHAFSNPKLGTGHLYDYDDSYNYDCEDDDDDDDDNEDDELGQEEGGGDKENIGRDWDQSRDRVGCKRRRPRPLRPGSGRLLLVSAAARKRRRDSSVHGDVSSDDELCM
ncbi:hypothetical protein SLS62_007047 [Diatrype stigma]|uniref:Uncharacterized protein n=1 Tax=Diatrype stigma TaxID=117547 RepID=A0AAN9UNG5_9PEZI